MLGDNASAWRYSRTKCLIRNAKIYLIRPNANALPRSVPAALVVTVSPGLPLAPANPPLNASVLLDVPVLLEGKPADATPRKKKSNINAHAAMDVLALSKARNASAVNH
jgi:hypothetical protein